LFPIGEFETKDKVREVAGKKGLITATKKDSQGLCFVGKTSLRRMLLTIIGEKIGEIVDTKGQKLGQHLGAFLYTLGQREGLGLSGGPWYVVKTDIKSNRVIVAKSEEKINFSTTKIIVKNLNYFLPKEKIVNLNLTSQARYHQKMIQTKIEALDKNNIVVTLSDPVFAITPGQTLVLFFEDKLVASGVISR